MSHSTTKPIKWYMQPAKTQSSLGIRPAGSQYSLSAWRNIGSSATHWAHCEDPDQTRRMPRLIWVSAGRTIHFVGFVMRRLKYHHGCFHNTAYVIYVFVFLLFFFLIEIQVYDLYTYCIRMDSLNQSFKLSMHLNCPSHRTGDCTSKCIPGMYCITADWPESDQCFLNMQILKSIFSLTYCTYFELK